MGICLSNIRVMGETISLLVSGFSQKAKSPAIIMVDLDPMVEISSGSNKKSLLKVMQGYILQQGAITGIYKTVVSFCSIRLTAKG